MSEQIKIGTKVRTADPLTPHEAAVNHPSRKAGALGAVSASVSGDRFGYVWIVHEDGTEAPYDASELTPVEALRLGQRVRTAARLTATAEQMAPWVGEIHHLASVMACRRAGAVGEVLSMSPGRSPQAPWVVRHDDGSTAPYAADELTPIPEAAPAPTTAIGRLRAVINRITGAHLHEHEWRAIDGAVDEVEREIEALRGGEAAAWQRTSNRAAWVALGIEDGPWTDDPTTREGYLLNEIATLRATNGGHMRTVLDAAKAPPVAARPRVGGWGESGEAGEWQANDDRGHAVAAVASEGRVFGWWANQPFRPCAGGIENTAEAAMAAAVAVLATWADVEGQAVKSEVEAPGLPLLVCDACGYSCRFAHLRPGMPCPVAGCDGGGKLMLEPAHVPLAKVGDVFECRHQTWEAFGRRFKVTGIIGERATLFHAMGQSPGLTVEIDERSLWNHAEWLKVEPVKAPQHGTTVPGLDLGTGIGGKPIRARYTAARPEPVEEDTRDESPVAADMPRILAAHARIERLPREAQHEARKRLSVSYSAEWTAVERGARIEGDEMVWPDGERYPRRTVEAKS